MAPSQGKIVLLSVILTLLTLNSYPVESANQGRGEVTMNGRIIASACAIDTKSSDQTIRMKTLPISQIMRNGESERQSFSITLVKCVLEKFHPALSDWRYFSVTFDGSEDAGHFGIDGTAQGIALKISDEYGNIAFPGTPMKQVSIHPGDMTFNYDLQLVGNRQILKAGEYASTVRFKMDYY